MKYRIPEFAAAALCIHDLHFHAPCHWIRKMNRPYTLNITSLMCSNIIMYSYPEWSFWRRTEIWRGCWLRTGSGQLSGPSEAWKVLSLCPGLPSTVSIMLLERSIFPCERVSSRSTWTSSHDFVIAQHADCKQMDSLRALNWFKTNWYHRRPSQKVLGELFSIILGSMNTRIWSDKLYFLLRSPKHRQTTTSQHKTLANGIGKSITTPKNY